MEKRDYILLVICILIVVLNVFSFFRLTGYVSQGNVGIDIASSCGDGVCSHGEDSTACSADCPVTTTTTPSAGGGGGGGGVVGKVTKRDFSVYPEVIEVSVVQGEVFKTSVIVKNTGNMAQDFQASISPNLKEFVSFSDKSFNLKAGEMKEIVLNFGLTKEALPDVYTGNLQIETASKIKKIPIIYEVDTRKILFDIRLKVHEEDKEIFPWEDLDLDIVLYNLGEIKEKDVFIEYVIKDLNGNIIFKQDEIVVVKDQISFFRTIKLPSKIKPWDYVVIVQAKYEDSVASSTEMISVVVLKIEYAVIFVIIVLFIIIFLIFLNKHRRKKAIKYIKKRKGWRRYKKKR